MGRDVIIIGDRTQPLYTFEDEPGGTKGGQIKTLTGVTGVDMVGNQLSVDELTPTVVYLSRRIWELWAPKGYQGLRTSDGYIFTHHILRPDLRKLPYGTPVYYYRNGALRGKYYSRNVERTAREFYQINAISAIGLLDKQQHRGGLYTGQTFDVVLADIIGSAVPYSCTEEVAAIKVYNWLPISTRRENLHQLLFACGVSVGRDESGDMLFRFLGGNPEKIVPDGRVYYGGDVDYSTPATGVEVTEHSYSAIQAVEPVTLYDNTQDVGGTPSEFVPFDGPMFDLQVTGTLRILDSGVNWAQLTGVGILTGRPYTHLTRVVSLKSVNAGQSEGNVIRVTDATLVNLTNSANVAKRLMEYYSSAKTIRAAISLTDERAGDLLALSDPFGEASHGFLERLEINVSANLKAECTIVTDYDPTPETPDFNNLEILTGEGDYIVPEGVTHLRAVIVQGGTGGSKGYSGGDVEVPRADSWSNSVESDATRYCAAMWSVKGGVGGEPGTPGEGGKVLIVEMDVIPGQVIHFACGVGGEGAPTAGVQDGALGSPGGETTFGDHSSANGNLYPGGWIEVLSGTVYASPGKAGYKGGPGSGGVWTRKLDPIWGYKETVEEFLAPTLEIEGKVFRPGTSYNEEIIHSDSVGAWNADYGAFSGLTVGSYGGGAAYGRDGNSGNRNSGSVLYRYEIGGGIEGRRYFGATGRPPYGGMGATPLAQPDETTIGKGGAAGCGGGGAGSHGVVRLENTVKKSGGVERGTLTVSGPPYVATGGSGGPGSRGGPGGIFVYTRRSAKPENTEEVR